MEESGRALFAVHRNGWWLVCLGEGEGGVLVWVMVIYLDRGDAVDYDEFMMMMRLTGWTMAVLVPSPGL